MSFSKKATTIYYGQFRAAVLRGEIPVNKEVSMEMNRIDDLIANPGVYYDDEAVKFHKVNREYLKSLGKDKSNESAIIKGNW